MRGGWLLMIVLASCHSAEKAPSPSPASTATPTSPSLASDQLAYLPASSDVVFKIDVAAVRQSPLGAKHAGAIMGFLAPSFAGCGYDPLADISTIMAGIPFSEELGIFVVRGLDREKTLACLRTSTMETRETATFDGEYVTLTNKSGAVNIFTFVDDRTLVMQGSKSPTKEGLRRAIDAGAPLRATGAAATLEQGFGAGAALSMVSRPGSAEVANKMRARLGTPAKAFRLTMQVTDAIVVHGAVTLESTEVATSLADGVKPQFEQLKSFVEHYDVRAEGASLVADVALTEAQIAAFVELVKSANEASQEIVDSLGRGAR